jgi:hypothetical protein
MKKMILGAAALFMVFAMSSCNQAPTVEVEKAQASMEAAKSVEADRYMAAEYTALNDSLTAVLTAIEAEKAESYSNRDFKPLVEKLNLIAANADSLKVTAEARKAEVRMQVEGMLVELNTLVAAQKEAISKVVVNAKNKEVVEATQNELAVVESTITEVNTLVSNGDYMTSMEKVTAAKEKATLVQTQLDAFTAKK